jgi:type II secretory pathway pseudopilin PulG
MIMAIIGIGAMIIVPDLTRAITRNHFDNEVRRLLADIRLMQQKSVTGQRNYGVEIDVGTDCYSTGEWSGSSFMPDSGSEYCFQYANASGSSYLDPPFTVYFTSLGGVENYTGSGNAVAGFVFGYAEGSHTTYEWIHIYPNGTFKIYTQQT